MRKKINFLIVNMAMSDLLYPIFVFPQILTELHVDSWLTSGSLGKAFCTVDVYLEYVSGAVSIQTLVLIAVDRFGAVVFPLRSPLFGSKMCLCLILVTWVFPVVMLAPMFFIARLLKPPGLAKGACWMRWNETLGDSLFRNYFLALSVIFISIPFTLIIILYTVILIKLKFQKVPGEQSVKAEELRTKRHRNVLKMAIVIVVGFAVCWMPFNILVAMAHFGHKITCKIHNYGLTARLMAHATCAVNPCVCFSFSERYRHALKNVLIRRNLKRE